MELSLFIELCLIFTTNVGSMSSSPCWECSLDVTASSLSLSLRLVSLRLRLSPSPSLSQSRVCNGRRSFEEITENTDFWRLKSTTWRRRRANKRRFSARLVLSYPILSCPILSYSALTHHDNTYQRRPCVLLTASGLLRNTREKWDHHHHENTRYCRSNDALPCSHHRKRVWSIHCGRVEWHRGMFVRKTIHSFIYSFVRSSIMMMRVSHCPLPLTYFFFSRLQIRNCMISSTSQSMSFQSSMPTICFRTWRFQSSWTAIGFRTWRNQTTKHWKYVQRKSR